MAQEQFAGPDYYTEFDPEKFLRDIAAQKAQQAEGEPQTGATEQGGGGEQAE
ncbi:hypothetical protein [Corynebacterium timonense]|uniref:Uncharacterized protein n=1 Tax=Corynebacterium timonense TaxID=441500 RepID=A0A1H1MCM7_9CORY|nr:hypothetical protein [Corynebacterium timonense]SDR84594.1 hypothetical protein SAMN04488539_0497 [Corynebacterium timonense]